MERDDLLKKIEEAERILIWMDGKSKDIARGDAEFSVVFAAWKEMVTASYRMPAFGVSLDSVTRKAMEQGLWAEFVFSKEGEADGMPFEKLLFEVRGDWRGFNLNRYWKGKYSGRCFYLQLADGKTMEGFARAIKEIL